LAEGTALRNLKSVLRSLLDAGIPSRKIYNIADIADDPHCRTREMILEPELLDGTLILLPGIMPSLVPRQAQLRDRRRIWVGIPIRILKALVLTMRHAKAGVSVESFEVSLWLT